MNKILENLKNNKIIHYGIILLISVCLFISLLKFNILKSHDGYIHILRTLGEKNNIVNNNIFSLIDAKYCNDFGYGMNIFYPITTILVPAFLNLVFNIGLSLKIYTLIVIFFTGTAMYKMTEKIFKNKLIALFSAVISMLYPYRLINIYTRFAMGEFTATIFIPLVFLGLYDILYEEGNEWYWLIIGTTGLLLTHTITAVYTGLFAFIFILFSIKKVNSYIKINKMILSVIWSILIAAFFVIPLIEHKLKTNYMIFQMDIMGGSAYEVFTNACSIKELLSFKLNSTSLNYGSGLFIILMLIIPIFNVKKIKDLFKSNNSLYLIFFELSIISLCMSTKYFPWFFMPSFMVMIQFGWRLINFFVLFISPFMGANLYCFIQNIKRKKYKVLVLIGVTIIIALNTVYFISEIYISRNDCCKEEYSENEYERKVEEKNAITYLAINPDYLPINSFERMLYEKENIKNKEKEEYYLLLNRNREINILQGNIEKCDKNIEYLNSKFELENIQEGTVIELPYLYYLCYKVNVVEEKDDCEIKNEKIDYFETENGCIGISFDHDIEKATVEIKYENTALEKASYGISLVSIISLISYIIIKNKKEKNEIFKK